MGGVESRVCETPMGLRGKPLTSVGFRAEIPPLARDQASICPNRRRLRRSEARPSAFAHRRAPFKDDWPFFGALLSRRVLSAPSAVLTLKVYAACVDFWPANHANSTN